MESELTSPGYPNNYTNLLNCEWVITAASSHRIAIRVTDINIEGTSGTCLSSCFLLKLICSPQAKQCNANYRRMPIVCVAL